MLDQSNQSSKSWLIIPICVLVFLIHAWSLMRYPAVNVDEAWEINRAWGYLQTGKIFGSMDYDKLAEYPGYQRVFPFLPVWIQAQELKIVGEPDLMVLRSGSLLAGGILLLMVYWIGSTLGTKITGWIAVLLTATSTTFFYSGHLARTDIYAAVIGFTALALAVRIPTSVIWLNFLAGLLASIAIEIRPLALVFPVTVLAVRFVRDMPNPFKEKGIWAMAAGVLSGGLIYIGVHILPSSDTYFHVMSLLFSESHTPPVMTLDPRVILLAGQRFFYGLLAMGLVELVIGIVAVLFIFIKKIPQRFLLLVLLLVPIITFFFVTGNAFTYNYILVTPLFNILIAVMVSHLPWKDSNQPRLSAVFSAVVVGILLGGVFFKVNLLRNNSWQNYHNTLAQVRTHIEANDRIMGYSILWFGLFEHDYDLREELVYYLNQHPTATLETAFLYFRPDIFVDDLDTKFISDKPEAAYQFSWISRQELLEVFGKYGKHVADVYGGEYGDLSIYRLSWP